MPFRNLKTTLQGYETPFRNLKATLQGYEMPFRNLKATSQGYKAILSNDKATYTLRMEEPLCHAARMPRTMTFGARGMTARGLLPTFAPDKNKT